MTNFEAISADIYPYDVSAGLIEKACLDNDVEPAKDYDKLQKKNIAMSVISILRKLISLNSESNGGYALSYDTDKLKQRIHSIAKENGLADIAEEFDMRPKVKFL